jgi:PAS domain S-box-containing protein
MVTTPPGALSAEVPGALWRSAMPALMLDSAHRVQALNAACIDLLGQPNQALTGVDLLDLQPAEDQEGARLARQQILALLASGQPAPPLRCRLQDGRGRQRWLVQTLLPVPKGWLVLLHDETGEQAARHQARRAEEELVHWFELSGTGMLVYDSSGLILRSNAAFEALVERVPEVVQEAPPELQALLAWVDGHMLPALQPGQSPLERQALMPLADGHRRRLWARLVCHPGEDGRRRVMAVVQDRSVEDERDLAQMEMGMLMDTATVRVATWEPTTGWLGARSSPDAQASLWPEAVPIERQPSLAIGVRRELVEAGSVADYERLQQALRAGERTEVRYAVRHPDLGTRWLLTRVEPASLSVGRPTMSVVTLDITEQESAQQRAQQLLRENSTILDSSTAGIAYFRGPALVRCNLRFERMLGFEPGAAAGASLEEILARSIGPLDGVREALDALAEGRPFEAELPVVRAVGPAQWYSLSVRRAQPQGEQTEAVAVLTDITRLKAQQAELEQLLRDRDLMFNLSEVGIVYQRGARIERANQAMAELTGWASPELGTLDVAELYEDTRACVDFEARIAHGLHEAGRFGAERLLRKRDGTLRWVQVAVRPVNTDDAEAGLICSFVDIDERRRSRETLARQAEHTRAILNSVLVGIVSVSDRGIEWMNRSARRMFAGELADFVGEPISIVATPEPEHPLRRVDWRHRLEAGHAETFECRMRGRDGREFWVVGNAVLSGGGGSGMGDEVTFALLDIERRRQAEVRIAQAQVSLQRVIETAPLAIALFDARTLRVQQVNQTASSFFGRLPEELLGASPEDCCPPAKAAALRAWLDAAARGEPRRQHEWREAEGAAAVQEASADASAEGAIAGRVWDCRVAPLDEGEGQASQLLLVATDVTEQRAAEQARLQAAIAQREVLVREVHHRIKNNLQGVAGLLQQTAARNPLLAPMLSEAVGQVQAIAQVYGLQVGSQGPLEAASLLRAIAQSVQRTFGRSIAVAVEGSVPHVLPEAESIPVALTLNELLTNAIKHGQGGDLRCELEARGEAIRIRIVGTGQLPAGFELGLIRGGVSGLGLVRALLPRRTATLTLQQQGGEVVAEVELQPPSVRWPQPGDQRQSGP